MTYSMRRCNRQLCIMLTHDDSRLLNTSRAGRLRKQLESRKNSAEHPGDFQDRCLRPLGHLSAQRNRALQALPRGGSLDGTRVIRRAPKNAA